MRPVVTDPSSVICRSVSRSELCKNDWTNRDVN